MRRDTPVVAVADDIGLDRDGAHEARHYFLCTVLLGKCEHTVYDHDCDDRPAEFWGTRSEREARGEPEEECERMGELSREHEQLPPGLGLDGFVRTD